MSSWATGHIAKLLKGETVQFRPRGQSMRGKVDSGSLVTVEPIKDKKTLRKGDIVLCTVKGREYLHLIKVIFAHCEKDYRYEIGNNRGGINGFIGPNRIYGLCTKVEK